MTRFLSDALAAEEPHFRLGLMKLEAANNHPSVDIRLTSEINVTTRAKVKELGLDPNDTTATELYAALKEKVRVDDQVLTKTLRTLAAKYVSAEADPLDGMVEAMKHLPDSKRCYGLKLAKLRSLLRATPPKKTVKLLGYRTLASMLRRESVVQIMAVAWLNESKAWQKQFLGQYKLLTPADFEDREISLLTGNAKHWQTFGLSVVQRHNSNILAFKELGVLVLLPLPKDIPPGVLTASLGLALHELNEIRALSTYLKLNQVKANFGELVAKLTTEEPQLSSNLLDRPMPWNLIQRYYASLSEHFKEEVFEPYAELEDMVWHPIEQSIAKIEPKLAFWQDVPHCCQLSDHKPVSFNIIDSALNLCNAKEFEDRLSRYLQKSLMGELMFRYLNHEPVERAVSLELQPKLALEEVTA
jgi:hypothetical protein